MVDVAVVLMDVAGRVGVERWSGSISSTTSLIVVDRAPPSTDTLRVGQVGVEQPCRHQFGRARGLLGALGDGPAGFAAGQRQHVDPVAGGRVAQQDPAGADLDVVGVRADRQHRSAGPVRAARR